MSSRGIIYAATGKKYIDEMLFSAVSARKIMPELPITLFTDLPDYLSSSDKELFDEIRLINEPLHNFGDKILPIMNSPYDETLFLDTDTIIVNPCLEIFEPLKRNDVAVTFQGYRSDFSFEELPISCPSYSTGVIAYRNTPEFKSFVEYWLEKQEEYARLKPDDQPSFRYCITNSDLRLHVLPNEYNFYPYYPSVVGGHSQVKIVHGHGPYAKGIAKVLDRRSKGPVIYGHIEIGVIVHWYFMKICKVLRRWRGVRWR